MPNIADWLTWASLRDSLNSAFTTSLVGALAGAYAGARAAQVITERAKERDNLIAQIRTTNAAIMVSFTVCNAYLSLKKQYVRDLHTAFLASRAELDEFNRRRKAGEIGKDVPFEFRADLRTIQLPAVPLDVLRSLVFDKLSVLDRPLALVSAITGAAASLNDTISKRQALIDKFRNFSPAERRLLPALYFGLPYAEGHMSTEYADTVEATSSLTDDVIFFSDLLCQDLYAYGEVQLANLRKLSKASAETIRRIDFSEARAAGLMPQTEMYQAWLKGFKKE